MNELLYRIVLPSGRKTKPYSRAKIAAALESGKLPPNALIEIDGSSISVSAFVERPNWFTGTAAASDTTPPERVVTTPPEIVVPPQKAKPVRHVSMAGIGCLMQFLGVASFAVGLLRVLSIIAPLILCPLGVWLFFAGSRESIWYECSLCGTRLTRKRVRMCPGCSASFK